MFKPGHKNLYMQLQYPLYPLTHLTPLPPFPPTLFSFSFTFFVAFAYFVICERMPLMCEMDHFVFDMSWPRTEIFHPVTELFHWLCGLGATEIEWKIPTWFPHNFRYFCHSKYGQWYGQHVTDSSSSSGSSSSSSDFRMKYYISYII